MGMAIITLKVKVQRYRGCAELSAIAIQARLAYLVNELPDFIVTEGEVESVYGIRGLEVVAEQLELGEEVLVPAPRLCRWCEVELDRSDVGRPREFCSDAHRQAEYRHRHNLA